MNKTVFLLIGIGSLVAVGAFSVSTLQVDSDNVQSQYIRTIDGSYTRKYIKIQKIDAENTDKNYTDNHTTLTDDSTTAAWKVWVESADASDTRKNILLEALDCVDKGVIYHQLRAGMGSPYKCPVSCDGHVYPDSSAYDFYAQANYSLADPLYLDCSFFIKHCYSVAGLEMISSNTQGMKNSGEFKTITYNEMVPGDIAVKRHGNSGHVIMLLGTTEDGQKMFIEMASHKDDMKMCTQTEETLNSQGYVYRRFNVLSNDISFVGK